MIVRKFAIADASFKRSPGQVGEVFAGNVIDQRHGGPITIGFGRYGPNESILETLAVDDLMVVLEGRLSVSAVASTVYVD
jgi:ethanolamine utilization protein EutQ (cupin superfamily)